MQWLLLLEVLLIRLKPKPAWFLLDAAWCASVAVWSAYRTFVHGELIQWLFAVGLIALARLDFQQYSYFQCAAAAGSGQSAKR
jgi:hypothetical protein